MQVRRQGGIVIRNCRKNSTAHRLRKLARRCSMSIRPFNFGVKGMSIRKCGKKAPTLNEAGRPLCSMSVPHREVQPTCVSTHPSATAGRDPHDSARLFDNSDHSGPSETGTKRCHPRLREEFWSTTTRNGWQQSGRLDMIIRNCGKKTRST
jgi:hypothetical protein